MKNLETYRHKEWIGYLQPVGLVVSPVALLEAGAIISPDVVPLQNTLTATLTPDFTIPDFTTLATQILEWQPYDLDNDPSHLQEYEHYLKEYEEILTPDYLVLDPDNEKPLMLVKCLEKGENLDKLDRTTVWHATLTIKFERLLRETQIHTGILYNEHQIRLIYAPAGETAGHLTFNLEDMTNVPGRVVLGALELLLSANRVFNQPKGRTLIDILQNSRQYQGQVTTKLSQQVLSSLWELLQGFQTAQYNSKNSLLKEVTPETLYGGLITILLRLVFLLYAEDEGLMPRDDIYTKNYGVTGLYSKLERDAANYTETMDFRYGAYAGLLSLFRLVHDGGGHIPNYLPARVGQLFDPNIYPFLEGRVPNPSPYPIPLISDGVIYRILKGLIILDGDRLSYRLLDVEQIGSVYEAIMGYQVEITTGSSIGIYSKPTGSKTSLTIIINLQELLEAKDRPKFLLDNTGCKLIGTSLTGNSVKRDKIK